MLLSHLKPHYTSTLTPFMSFLSLLESPWKVNVYLVICKGYHVPFRLWSCVWHMILRKCYGVVQMSTVQPVNFPFGLLEKGPHYRFRSTGRVSPVEQKQSDVQCGRGATTLRERVNGMVTVPRKQKYMPVQLVLAMCVTAFVFCYHSKRAEIWKCCFSAKMVFWTFAISLQKA